MFQETKGHKLLSCLVGDSLLEVSLSFNRCQISIQQIHIFYTVASEKNTDSHMGSMYCVILQYLRNMTSYISYVNLEVENCQNFLVFASRFAVAISLQETKSFNLLFANIIS